MALRLAERGTGWHKWVCATFAAVAIAPATAHASLIDVADNPGHTATTIFYSADPGETNDLVISQQGGDYYFDEPFDTASGHAIQWSPPGACQYVQANDPGWVKCQVPSPLSSIVVTLGDQSDHVTTTVPVSHNLQGNDGADTLAGGPMADTFFGGDDVDNMNGGDGDDQFHPDDGLDMTPSADHVDGGAGEDTVFYDQASTGVSVDLVAGTGGEVGALDTLLRIEDVFGSSNADTLSGDGNDNGLSGGDGADEIDGLGGADLLVGGSDADTLRAGADTAVDTLFGDHGDDQLFADDGSSTPDSISCGEENDSGTADPADDVASDCENVAQAVSPPSPTAAPTISGTARQGEKLTASNGSWSGSPTSFGYQWLRCGTDGAGCSDIGGATAQTYVLTADDVGHKVRVRVTALNSGGSGSDESQPTAIVEASTSTPATTTTSDQAAPVATANPTIVGSPFTLRAAGQTLTGQPGTWTGTPPPTFKYVWLRCSPNQTLQCVAATAAGPLVPYRLVEQDIGKRMRLAEIASNTAGQTVAFSAPTTVVTGVLRNTELPKVWGPLYRRGTLHAIPGGWAGTQPFKFNYAWESCAADGSDCERRGSEETQSVSSADVGRRFRVSVTAFDARTARGSATSSLTPAVRQRPKMPNLLPVAHDDEYSYLTLAKAKGKLASRGLCFLDGQVCGFKMPINLELVRRGKQDVPRKYHSSISSGRVYDHRPDPDSELGIGEDVALTVYDPARNDLCRKYRNMDINDVKAELGTNPDTVYEKLAFEYCEIAGTVHTQAAVDKTIVYDINRDPTDDSFTIYVYDPRPKRAYQAVPQVDTDGDGLWDDWETLGVDVDKDGYYDLDLPAMGADPRHKDIFMEIDYMENHKLDQAAIDSVTAAFAAAPVPNPDGSSGIAMHIDNGPDSIMNPRTGAKWDTRSDSDQLPHIDQLGSTDSQSAYDWGPYQNLKDGHFLSARSTAFRYVISLHTFKGTAIGLARDLPDADKLGYTGLGGSSDLIVAANQPCKEGHCPLTPRQQGVNLMHELGHLLGLGHGGRAGGANGVPDLLNGKPNYFSIMNYLFSFNGLKKADGTFVTDYSRFTDAQTAINAKLNPVGSAYTLLENGLDERSTTRALGAAAQFTSAYKCVAPGAKTVSFYALPSLNQQIDWDCDGTFEAPLQSSDLNNDGSLNNFVSRDDWQNLKFTGGAVGQFNEPPATHEKSRLPEPTAPELLKAAQVEAGDAKRPTVALRIGRATRRGKAKLRFSARDNKALAQLVVLLDGEQRTFHLRGKRSVRKMAVGPGRHRIRVESQDAVGNYSKPRVARFRARTRH